MQSSWLIICFFALLNLGQSQTNPKGKTEQQNDTIKKAKLIRYIGNGYFPTKYFDFDLRYLIKYNQFEGFRTGLGGVTSKNFSNRFRITGYTVYGFLDRKYKYSIGGGFKVFPNSNTWINASYTKDLHETGSSNFIIDKRFFQFFEPRLINIELFHKYISKIVSIEHQISPKIVTETEFSVRKIAPTYSYAYRASQNRKFSRFDLTLARISMQWSPFSVFVKSDKGVKETKNEYPKFTLQYTKSFRDVLKSDFNFSKIDFRTIQQFDHASNSNTRLVLTAGLAQGDVPITHMYNAYPNNVNKETIMQRFSVAGNTGFETMYFNEFFSDRLVTFQCKHVLEPLKITPWFQPQFALITKHAIGNMRHQNRHEDIEFNTLEQGYSESGIEINKLFLGFGLSFSYRYGAYHLSRFEDNFAFKFTFNMKLN
ncbi:MAG: hypothetical protein HRT67_02350 [Flavobacteriaceae bacterium]|nr:hypothetical protein [Flavobacteriaceae bacterium]